MTADILIGIDAGTSVIKAVAFTTAGEQLAVASVPNSYATLGGGQVEQDMVRTWSDCAATLRDLAGKVPDLARRLAAIAVTAQGDGTWLIDADGEPVGGGLLWLDSRAAAICADYMATPAYARHYALTGSGLNACMASGQIAWMKRHQPERLARATTACHCKDWIYFKLTGDRATDPAEANFTFGNYRTRQYEPFILEAMGIGEFQRLLPPIVEGTQVAGRLFGAAASLTGLREGTPVVLAYLDTTCTGLGGGLYERGADVGVSVLGSTGMHMRFVPNPDEVVLNADRTGYTKLFPVPGASVQMQSHMAATLNIDWFLDVARDAAGLVGSKPTRADLLQGMDERILAAEPGSALYHPYIFEAGERGPFLDPNARAQFSGLSTRTSFMGMVRAVYEGLAFASLDCYRATGSVPREVRLNGGAARSRAMRLILASVLGVPVRTLSRAETGAAGAAMMAAVCLGLYPDMAACAEEWVTPYLGEATAPDPGLTPLYAPLYSVYLSERRAMTPVWAELGRTRQDRSA